MKNVVESTQVLFQELFRGRSFKQSEVGKLTWEANHPGEHYPEHVYSYYHASLENHVREGRICKTTTKSRGITYKITPKGRKFVRECEIV